MGNILDQIGASQFSYQAGSSGTVTVPAGVFVTAIAVHATSAGSFTITPKGPGTVAPATAGASVPIPAGVGFSLEFLGELGPGTVIVFTGTDMYFVRQAKLSGGFS
jgi:hypothetical protein